MMYGSQLVFNSPYKNNIQSTGLTLKFSTDYFFRDLKTINPFFKLTWIRAGLGYAFNGHPFIYLTPVNVGFGTAIQLNKTNTLELCVNGGIALVGFADFPDAEGFITPILVPEIKYRHKKFAIAAEVTYRKSAETLEESTFTSTLLPNQTYYRYLYYGLTFTLPL